MTQINGQETLTGFGVNPILSASQRVKRLIEEEGRPFEETKEVLGVNITLALSNLDVNRIEQEIIDYYGIAKYHKRLEGEIFHYNQIRYSLLHKVEELAFFNGTGLENRKIIVFSNDCISSVQYLKRAGEALLMVHMRSSDVEALLPMDLLYLLKMFKEVSSYYTSTDRVFHTGTVKSETMIVSIGSAHYYVSGGRE